MFFRICEENEQILYQRNIVCLRIDNRTDHGYQTAFDATFYDTLGRKKHLGIVKIGRKGMKPGFIRDDLPKEFAKLPNNFFSLGQDEDYYERIKELGRKLGVEVRTTMLGAIRDVAFDLTIFDSNKYEQVMIQSLLANIVTDDDDERRKAVAKVKGQFNRMAEKGGSRLTKYHFTYTAPRTEKKDIVPTALEFIVEPESNPPSNIHAMIGRNGCGKTYLIHHMVKCLQDRNGGHGKFTYHGEPEEIREFANVVCIAFSPFDRFPQPVMRKSDIPASFVGLNEDIFRESSNNSEQDPEKNRLIEAIGDQFWDYLCNCLITEQRQRLWLDAVEIIKKEFDEHGSGIFREIKNLMERMKEQMDEELLQSRRRSIMDVFGQLSSGHKVVLLTLTSCVAEIEERTILFLDEPENHLHAPLLSALIRSLSDLLRKRNGVAIISTHSPVVLQEVPSVCVQVLDRYGSRIKVRKPKIKTFGATVGSLSQEVFGLKSRDSGFYQLLKQAVDEYGAYDEVVKLFGDQLGDQAELMLYTLLMLNERKEK